MPDRLPENVPGPFYVNSECIGCGLCVSTAEAHFKMTDDDSVAFVFRQPDNEAETALCEEAREDCPTDAIERE
jgi:ferredoxin